MRLALMAIGSWVSVAHADPVPAPELAVGVGGGAYDESPFSWSHYLVSLSTRVHVTQRLAIDGEVVYLDGFCGADTCWPSGHKDVSASAALSIDLRSGRPPVMPYAVLGIGYLAFGDSGLDRRDVAAVIGFGIRFAIGEHFFVSPDLRLMITKHGHLNTSLMAGVRF